MSRDFRFQPPLVGGDKVTEVPVSKIRSRCKNLYKNKSALAIGKIYISDVISDWRDTEKTMEKHFTKVNFIQRDDSSE